MNTANHVVVSVRACCTDPRLQGGYQDKRGLSLTIRKGNIYATEHLDHAT